MGKLIVIEGTDGSGKATQSGLLCKYLEREGIPYRKIDFPRYGKPSARECPHEFRYPFLSGASSAP